MVRNDLSARLPDGTMFDFWERECNWSRTLHVDCESPAASDENDGSEAHPFRTIHAAAEVAEPGTRILIHAGLYRECVQPAMGGTDAEHMISYEAFGDGKVIIRASDEVKDFRKSTGWQLTRGRGSDVDTASIRVWEHELDPDMFRGYNPFCAINLIHDRLFIEYAKTDMLPYLNRRGCVFVDGVPMKQVALYNQLSLEDNTYWVEANGMKVHFRLKGDGDPKDHLIELTVREQCFAPREPFLSYIRVKGLICEHAATGAPVPQRGAISANRGHHWVIEDCEVNWTNTLAMDVGNECWHREVLPEQQIGYAVIRNCRIRDAGVCGIAGIYATHVLIEGCEIVGTGWQHMELSWEAAGIKLHDTVNSLFRNNVIHHTYWADHVWLDCNNVNTRITGNVFMDGVHQREAIFIECTRDGVNLIDNNIIWGVDGRFDPASIPDEPGSTGWYKLAEHDAVNGYAIYCEGTDRLQIAHNLIGECRYGGYYAKPVGFRMGADGNDRGGTSRKANIRNNIFCNCGESAITFPTEDNQAEGNLYVNQNGGYLRVMYPAPETCLHLAAWREFNGFDLTGQAGWFDIRLEDRKILFSPTVRIRPKQPAAMRSVPCVTDPRMIGEAESVEMANTDFFGNDRAGKPILPGPFTEILPEIRILP